MSESGSITFVPSVHFSAVHRRRVRNTINDSQPDIVAIELDERRYDRLRQQTRLEAGGLARELPTGTSSTYRTLRAIQQTVARMYGLDPGQTDMETAIETAADLDIETALIDEPIDEIMESISARVGLATIPKMLLRAQFIDPGEWVQQAGLLLRPVSHIESGDDVQPAVDQLRRLLPEVADVLIDTRDRAMAHRLHKLRTEGHDVVAVIGAGHHNGIQTILGELPGQAVDPDVAVPLRSPTREVTTIPVES